jgi:hypothetical protein
MRDFTVHRGQATGVEPEVKQSRRVLRNRES